MSTSLTNLPVCIQVLYGLTSDALDHTAEGIQDAYVFNNTGCVKGGQQAFQRLNCTLIPCHEFQSELEHCASCQDNRSKSLLPLVHRRKLVRIT